MEKFKDILIVSDIDGTLLGSNHKIPSRNIEAIKYFTQNGGKFSIATARTIQSAKRFYKELDLQFPTVLCNGALIYNYEHDKIIDDVILPKIAIDFIKEIGYNFPDAGVEITVGRDLYIANECKLARNFERTYKLNYKYTSIEEIPQGWNKAVFICSDDMLIELDKFCKSKKYQNVNLTPTATFLYEMMPSDATKATGVLKLADYLNVDIKNTYAIGDYFNDLEMLASVGHGVTVANAPDEIKNICELTVGDFENGAIADLIEILDKQ